MRHFLSRFVVFPKSRVRSSFGPGLLVLKFLFRHCRGRRGRGSLYWSFLLTFLYNRFLDFAKINRLSNLGVFNVEFKVFRQGFYILCLRIWSKILSARSSEMPGIAARTSGEA